MAPLLVLVSALGCQSAHAQSGPEIHVQSSSGLSVQAVNDVSTEAVDTRLRIFAAGFSTPLPPLRLLEERWVVIPMADFEYTRLRYEGGLLPVSEGHDLFRVRLGLINIVGVTDRLSAVVLAQPGLYSDFGGPLSTDDVGGTAVALGSWAVSESLSVGAGAGNVLIFGRPRWTPVVQVRLDQVRLQVDAVLPLSATAWWNAAGPLWLGAEAEIDGGFYRLHPDSADGGQAVFQEYSRSRVGLGARLRVQDTLILELTGSAIPKTRATLYLDADTALFDYQLSPGWSVVGQARLQPGR